MAQVARDEVAALIDETLMAVHAASVPDHLDRDSMRILDVQIGNVRQLADRERLVRVANIARHLQRLLSAVEADGPSDRHAAAVRRGLDVLSLLVQDAQRQRDGHPAAALDDAVDCFLDHVEQTLRGERGARIMRFPKSRMHSGEPALASCPTPTGTV